jgi:hypothetical protein
LRHEASLADSYGRQLLLRAITLFDYISFLTVAATQIFTSSHKRGHFLLIGQITLLHRNNFTPSSVTGTQVCSTREKDLVDQCCMSNF